MPEHTNDSSNGFIRAPANIQNTSGTVRDAAKLVHKALQPSLTPVSDSEYRTLLAIFRNESTFRHHVEDILVGLDLVLLDVSERGMFIAPGGQLSRFAFKLSDFKSTMNEGEKAALVLTHVTIASVFFPTTESVDDEDQLVNPASIAQIRDALLNMATSLKEKQEHDAEENIVQPGWECILRLPIAIPHAQKASTSSVVGLIKIALNNLREAGMIRPHLVSEEMIMETYTPTHRYRVQLRELTMRKLLEVARQARQNKNKDIEN